VTADRTQLSGDSEAFPGPFRNGLSGIAITSQRRLDHIVGGLLPLRVEAAPEDAAPEGDRMSALSETVRALEGAGLRAEDIALRRPTLDEVFLHLTGSTARSDEEQEVTA
jgi:hypothetical protein